MEIRFRAKRAAFNMTVTTPPLIVEDEFLLQDKKGHYQNCDGNTLEIVIDGQAVRVAKIKELCGVDDGVPRQLDRSKRIKALGNAIVPQVAYELFRTIKQIEKDL